MKFRLLDLLQCPCGKSSLVLNNQVTKEVPFADSLIEVRCKSHCAFKQCSAADGKVRPADCTQCYAQEIVSGALHCECGQEWPIVDGIPRFLPELAADFQKIQATFSFEWKMFRFGERNWGQDITYRKNLFLQGMGASPADLKGRLVFDAGCGSGLLSMEMAKSFGMEVVALDLAFGIQKAYEKNDSPYVHFVQGSVVDPPLRDGVFDFVYCAGVLVACPNTHEGFRAIVPTLKVGGRCFIWVYHPIDATFHPHDRRKMLVYNWIRKNITSRLPIRLQYLVYLCSLPAFLMKMSVEKLLRKGNPRTWREKMQNLFDTFSPIYQNRHTPEEVFQWYSDAGFYNVEMSDKGPYGFGVRGDL